jgi:biotin transporter BioY
MRRVVSPWLPASAATMAAFAAAAGINTGSVWAQRRLRVLSRIFRRRASTAHLVLVVLVAAGLPLLADGRGGLGLSARPSAGSGLAFGASVLGGMLLVYAIGAPVRAWRTHTSLPVAPLIAVVVSPPGDALGVAIATLLAQQVNRAYPVSGPVQAAMGRRSAWP